MNPKARLTLLLSIGILPLLLNGFYNSHISRTPFVYWTAEVLTWVVLPFTLFWNAINNRLFTNREIGLHGKIFGRSSWILFIFLTFVLACVVVIADRYAFFLVQKIFPVNYGVVNFTYRDVVPSSGLLRFLVLLHLCVSAGLIEELYFRGLSRLLFPKNWSGSLCYIAITAIVFSLAHWEGGVWNLTEALFFGLAVSTLYVFTGNLWPIIIGHSLNDLLLFSATRY